MGRTIASLMLEVSMLGPVEVAVDGERKEIGSPTQRTLLAALAMRPGSVVSAHRLIDLIWGEEPPSNALTGLHVYISRLRKVVGADHLLTRTPGYALAGATNDVARFEELATADSFEKLSAAMDLWRGDPFSDLPDRDVFRAEAIRMHQLRESVAERRVEAALQNDPVWAVAEAQALCEAEPLRENRWALLARAMDRAGQKPEAIRALARARDVLGEVGLEPSSLITELEDELLTSGAPSVSSRQGTPVVSPATPMLGRETELEALRGLLESKRMITLVGPGGVGKTHLARAATAVADSARWCELAHIEDAGAVAAAVARAVGSPVTGEIEATLLEALRTDDLLLVLDNCEHLVEETARLVEALLDSCPNVTVLATSRERLAVPAEWILKIEPLDPARTAVDLFRERAQASGVPAESLDHGEVERICRLLDGLPLAVEMAASRMSSMGVSELAERLEGSFGVLTPGTRTAPRRHRTLEEVVAWSVDLLAPSERLTLDRCSVFSGGFDLETAEDVIGYDPLEGRHLAVMLGALVDRSLLAVDRMGSSARYLMLDTVRRVVRAWLSPDAAAEVGRRHGHHYARLAERLGDSLLGPAESTASSLVLENLPDLRSAVFRSTPSEPEVSVRVCAALYPLAYHQMRADIAAWADGIFETVAGIGHPMVPTVGAMAALHAIQRGDLTAAGHRCRRARAAATSADQRFHVIEVEGDLAAYTGPLSDLDAFAEEIVTAARQKAEASAEMMALVNVGLLRAYAGDFDSATEAVAKLRPLEASLDSRTMSAWVDYVEGEVVLDRDPAKALRLLDSAISTARTAGNRFVEGAAGLSSASLHARYGETRTARDRFVQIIRHWLEVGDWVHQWVTLRNLALLLERLDDLEGAALLLGKVARTERPTYGEEAARIHDLETRLEDGLGITSYEEARRRGARLSDRQVVDLALSRLEAEPQIG